MQYQTTLGLNGGVTMFGVRRILYPTDFSSYSNHAYFHAVAVAENFGATLTICYVVPNDQLSQFDYWKGQLEQIRPSNQNIPVTHVILQGDPASEIVRFADESGIDLIVMGTHGRTGVDRLLMGSVAELVLRGAHCSIMCVKLPKGKPDPEKPHVS